MDDGKFNWKIDIKELKNTEKQQSGEYTFEYQKYSFEFVLQGDNIYLCIKYRHNIDILSFLISVKNREDAKNHNFKILFKAENGGTKEIPFPISYKELLDPQNGWIQDDGSLELDISIEAITEKQDNSNEYTKTIDYTLGEYSIIDSYKIPSIKQNSIDNRFSCEFKFGSSDEIKFNFQGKSNPTGNLELAINFTPDSPPGIYSVFIELINSNKLNSIFVYKDVPIDATRLCGSLVFDLPSSDFRQLNGWIFRQSAQFLFKVSNRKFTEYPKMVSNFLRGEGNDGRFGLDSNAGYGRGHFGRGSPVTNSLADATSFLNDEPRFFEEVGTFSNGFEGISGRAIEKNPGGKIGLAGLKNQGATCYLNSAIQFLFYIPAFRRVVYQIDIKNAKEIALSLQKLFYEMQKENSGSCSTCGLTNSFGMNQRDLFLQHDVQEFIRLLIDNLDTQLNGTNMQNKIVELFRGSTKTYVSAPAVNYETSKEEFFDDLQLEVRGFSRLEDSLRDFLKTEKLTGNNMYKIEGHGLQEAEMRIEITKLPPVLLIHLKRFEYDFKSNAQIKINDRFEFPDSLDFTSYLAELENPEESNIYDLHCILVHSGFAQLGHYYVFIRQLIKKDENGEFIRNDDVNDWFKFNDELVSNSSFDEAVTSNFGGESYSAYMLVYVKRDEVTSLLKPIDDDEIPAHLHEHFQQNSCSDLHTFHSMNDPTHNIDYNNQDEKKNMKISFMTEGTFFANFTKDICEMKLKEKTVTIEIPTYTIEELYESAEKALSVPPGTIRLWEVTDEFKPYQPFYEITHSYHPDKFFIELKKPEDPLKPPEAQEVTVFIIFFDNSLEIPAQYLGSEKVKEHEPISTIYKAVSSKLSLPEDTEYVAYREVSGRYPFSQIEGNYELKEKSAFVVLHLKDDDANHTILKKCRYNWHDREFYESNLAPIDNLDEFNSVPFVNHLYQKREKLSEVIEFFFAVKRYVYLLIHDIRAPEKPLLRIKTSTVFPVDEIVDLISNSLSLNYDKSQDSLLLFNNCTDFSSPYLSSFDNMMARTEHNLYFQVVKDMTIYMVKQCKQARVSIALDGYNVSLQTRVFVEQGILSPKIVSSLVSDGFLDGSIFGISNNEEMSKDDLFFEAFSWIENDKVRICQIENHRIIQTLSAEDEIPFSICDIKIDIVPESQMNLNNERFLVRGSHLSKSSATEENVDHPFMFVIDMEERARELKERVKQLIKIEQPWSKCRLLVGNRDLSNEDASKIQYIIDRKNADLTIVHDNMNDKLAHLFNSQG